MLAEIMPRVIIAGVCFAIIGIVLFIMKHWRCCKERCADRQRNEPSIEELVIGQ